VLLQQNQLVHTTRMLSSRQFTTASQIISGHTHYGGHVVLVSYLQVSCGSRMISHGGGGPILPCEYCFVASHALQYAFMQSLLHELPWQPSSVLQLPFWVCRAGVQLH
jgi:hypothetical protein